MNHDQIKEIERQLRLAAAASDAALSEIRQFRPETPWEETKGNAQRITEYCQTAETAINRVTDLMPLFESDQLDPQGGF